MGSDQAPVGARQFLTHTLSAAEASAHLWMSRAVRRQTRPCSCGYVWNRCHHRKPKKINLLSIGARLAFLPGNCVGRREVTRWQRLNLQTRQNPTTHSPGRYSRPGRASTGRANMVGQKKIAMTMFASPAILGLLLAGSACSKQSSKPTQAGVSSPDSLIHYKHGGNASDGSGQLR